MHAYIPRRLAYQENGERKEIADVDVLDLSGPVVVLGEPGMGKTELLTMLAERAGVHVLRAGFVAGAPIRTAGAERLLIIDGLDQMAGAKEGSALDDVFARLAEAGAPPCIISCRMLDWNASVAKQNARDVYGRPMRELTLEPFSVDDARSYMEGRLPAEQVESLLERLAKARLDDLLKNPLTTFMLMTVLEDGRDLPTTRAGLYEEAVDVLRKENVIGGRRASPLTKLGRDAALDAAGALSAAMLLGGTEKIAVDQVLIEDARVLTAADVGEYFGSDAVEAILGSRLFKAADEPGHVEPIHRTVAEYLGARWLARQAPDARARSRILALMVVEDGVPASLRGLHAWLAHWPGFADAVIDRDPLGLLEYGDAEGLAPATSRKLLAGLRALEATNPGFRNDAGRDRSMRAFTRRELVDDVSTLLSDDKVGYQLRSTVLQAIGGSPVAAALSDGIVAIALAGEGVYTYVERSSALSSLVSDELRHTCVYRLIDRAGIDDTRLALEMMASDQERFEPAVMATALLGHLGFLPEQVVPEAESLDDERRVTGVPFYFAHRLSGRIAGPVLDELAAICRMDDDDWSERKSDLWTMLDVLISKAVTYENPEPRRLLAWLEVAPRETGRSDDWARAVAEFIRQNEEIRREIQRIVLLGPARSDAEDRDFWALHRLNPNLHPDRDDLLSLLDDLAEVPTASAHEVAVWRLVVTALRDEAGLADEVAASAGRFAAGYPERQSFLAEMALPKPTPEWKIRDEQRRLAVHAERRADWNKARVHYRGIVDELRCGAFRALLYPARCYLGHFRDIDANAAPPDRVSEWLGNELRDASLAGFDAFLGRKDLPTPADIAEAYAEEKTWNTIFPLVVGLTERLRRGQSLVDVPENVIRSAGLALFERTVDRVIGGVALGDAVDAWLRREPARFEAFVRQMIEPALERRAAHPTGLWDLPGAPDDEPLIARLAAEWLNRFPDLPDDVEARLIDILFRAGSWDSLRLLAEVRSDAEGDARRRRWQAVALVLDFERAAARLGTLDERDKPLLWALRGRIGYWRNEVKSPATAACIAWIIRRFRSLWPHVTREIGGAFRSDMEPVDASEFLHGLVDRLAADPSPEASDALSELVAAPADGYAVHLRRALHEQSRERREKSFVPVTISELKQVVTAGPPATPEDLRTCVMQALDDAQNRVKGADTDLVDNFWHGLEEARPEDWCTKKLKEALEPLLPRGVSQELQPQMPWDKRADLLLTVPHPADGKPIALPIEAKGQWNQKLWTAASAQLDDLYLRDWRATDGIYLVYWFGPAVPNEKRRLHPPAGGHIPRTPEELRRMLEGTIPIHRRESIIVFVLDLTRPR